MNPPMMPPTSGRFAALEPRRPADCLSDFALDGWRADELAEGQRQSVVAHVAACARCAARVSALDAEARVFPPQAAVASAAAPPRRRGRAAVPLGLGALAAAAAIAVVTIGRPGDHPGTRIKGQVRLGIYVKHGAEIRRGASGEEVEAGDALRFTVTTPSRGWLAVFSRDGSGRASIYFPASGSPGAASPDMAPVEPAHDLALPASTVLDEVPGRETLHGLFCARPVALEPIRAALARGEALDPPAGCVADTIVIDKQVRER